MGPDVPKNGVGGTAFKRSGYAKPVEAGARAYPLLTTVQTGAGNTVGPGQFMKVRPVQRCSDLAAKYNTDMKFKVGPDDRESKGVKMRLNALKVPTA